MFSRVDWKKRLDKKIKKIESSDIDRRSRKAIIRSVRIWKSRGISNRRIVRILEFLYCFCGFYRGDITRIGESKLIDSLGRINDSKYSDETIESMKAAVKEFYRHCGTEKQLKLVMKHMIRHEPKSKLKPCDMITREEFIAINNNAANITERAFYELLRYSGLRFSEALSVRARDIKQYDITYNGKQFTLTYVSISDSKTNIRTVPILEIMPALINIWNAVPDDNCFLFPQQSDGTYNKKLRDTCRRAGITRRIWLHLFRHTRFTELSDMGIRDDIIKWFLGWSEDSKMPSRYRHLTIGQNERLFLLPQLTHHELFGTHNLIFPMGQL